MQRRTAATLLVLVAFMAGWLGATVRPCRAAQGHDAQAAEELKKLEQDWASAYEKTDDQFIARHLSDDYMFSDPNGTLSDKNTTVADVKSGTLAISAMSLDDLKIR